jgi:hypothetical protein
MPFVCRNSLSVGSLSEHLGVQLGIICLRESKVSSSWDGGFRLRYLYLYLQLRVSHMTDESFGYWFLRIDCSWTMKMGRYQPHVGRNADLLSSIHRTGRIFQNSPYRIAEEVNITHNRCQPRSQCWCPNLKQHIRNDTIGAQIMHLTTRGSSILVLHAFVKALDNTVSHPEYRPDHVYYPAMMARYLSMLVSRANRVRSNSVTREGVGLK